MLGVVLVLCGSSVGSCVVFLVYTWIFTSGDTSWWTGATIGLTSIPTSDDIMVGGKLITFNRSTRSRGLRLSAAGDRSLLF